MEKKNAEIQKYWDERAGQAKLNTNATTDDVFLRELEVRTFVENIKKLKAKPSVILDLGCGDGFTTLSVAKKLKGIKFIGVDYSANMIANANERLALDEDTTVKKRIQFLVGDATKILEQFGKEKFDVVISSRCLINLTSAKQQFDSIKQISQILKKNGHYIAIENFIDGNDELNALRKHMGLSEISVRWHNLFFKPKEFMMKSKKYFRSAQIIDFSSSYYFATRVIYSKYCMMKDISPDYRHEIHQLAIDLPNQGNFSPIKLIFNKK